MFNIQQTANNTYRVGCTNADDYNKLPHNINCAIHWRTFKTAQEAFQVAAGWWFQICDERR